jgi:hypothetical protein
MNEKQIVHWGVPVAAIVGVYFDLINGDIPCLLAGIMAAWAFFEYR